MTTLFYYSKSADKKPGKGANEVLLAADETDFQELAKIKNWRHVLSNFHEGEFEYDGRRYGTAEHAFQGCKIALVDRCKGEMFSLESNNAIALGNGEIARKNRKLVVLSYSQLAQWSKIKDSVMGGIMRAKFTQVKLARTVLLATRCAQLWHGTRGVPKARQVLLEEVREGLQRADEGEREVPEPKVALTEEKVAIVNTGDVPSSRKRKAE